MKNIDLIFEYIKVNWKLQYSDLLKKFSNINESTLTRNLKKLLEQDNIRKEEIWKNTFYMLASGEYALKYFEIPFFDREEKKYNFDFLLNYIPNKTHLLLPEQTKILLDSSSDLEINTNYYQENRRSLENLLIDLSFASSKLEWNTYSYLDTEVLVNYNEIAEGKQKDETQMILNHKNAIEYLVYYKNKLGYEAKTFFEIHTLLWNWLLPKLELWKIREKTVEIWRSKYIPLDNKFQLKEQFEIFLSKLREIKNPFEQSLFILVFIPYFQLFLDINKRTSRILCNLPLIKNNLWILSLLQVKERDYITAILAIYELNDVSLMRDLFVNNYLLNYKRYV